jgi:hypothetical protein
VARVFFGPLMVQDLHSNRVKFLAQTAAGATITGFLAAPPVVERARNGETPGTIITPTIIEVDAASMPGLYEIRLAATDLAVAGHLCLLVTGGTIDPTYIFCTVLPRVSLVTA